MFISLLSKICLFCLPFTHAEDLWWKSTSIYQVITLIMSTLFLNEVLCCEEGGNCEKTKKTTYKLLQPTRVNTTIWYG